MSQRVIDVSVIFAAALLLLLSQTQSASAQAAAQSHLYFFTNDGCAPCRQVEPAIEALHRDGYPVSTINVSQQPQWANHFQVDRTPTIILTTGDRITGRHTGQIDLATLKEWFAAVGQRPVRQTSVATNALGLADRTQPKPAAGLITRPSQGTKVVVDEAGKRSTDSFTSPTIHHGTSRPANAIEGRALAATVRLKVEDPEGISYATGTIVHARPGEALVLTCGHVFRDANGKGIITAEYGFDSGNLESVPGQLIHYDAKAHDIGLVAIQTNGTLTPVAVASADAQVARGDQAFSIGCDHGKNPTIRHTAIKNRATYDGEIKYDIYGRPVDGRSGGGLFDERGQLIGVCNAAAVEVDEGIYSGLNTIHWQFAQTNLGDLFAPETNLAVAKNPAANRFASLDDERSRSQQTFASAIANQRKASPRTRIVPRQQLVGGSPNARPANSQASYQPDRAGPERHRSTVASDSTNSDMEVIILVRSKTDPSIADTITVADPSDQLLGFLSEMQRTAQAPRQLDFAQLRKRGEYQPDWPEADDLRHSDPGHRR